MKTLEVVNGKLVITTDRTETINKAQYNRRLAKIRQRIDQADNRIAAIQAEKTKLEQVLSEYLVHEQEMG